MSIAIVEKSASGLSRVFAVTVTAQSLAEKLSHKLNEVAPQIRLKGFRPGKVPKGHVKRLYGQGLMQEIITKTFQEARDKAISEAELRLIGEPDVTLSTDMGAVLEGKSDLEFDLLVELMPQFEPLELSNINLTRLNYLPNDADLEKALAEIAKNNRSFTPKKGKAVKAAEGDQLKIDFTGRIDGEVFEGGSATDVDLILGENRFIPGFEDQLKGAKPGAEVLVEVTFPDDYHPPLAGKAAVFTVIVKEIKSGKVPEIDDDLAKAVGFETLENLRQNFKEHLSEEYGNLSRMKLKRALLDALDKAYDFELPARMLDQEFSAIWHQFVHARDAGDVEEEDRQKSEEELKADYRKIAERRVRLGLVLAETGRLNQVNVIEEDIQNAVRRELLQNPGREQEIIQFYTKNPQAIAQLRAPVYEEKVVDFILSKVQITDKDVSKEELMADDDLPDGYES